MLDSVVATRCGCACRIASLDEHQHLITGEITGISAEIALDSPPGGVLDIQVSDVTGAAVPGAVVTLPRTQLLAVGAPCWFKT